MDWTSDKPIENGDYWFRYADNKPAQVVKVQDDIVTFRSGKKKHISKLLGEWGGAVTSGEQSMFQAQPPSGHTETWPKLLAKLILGAFLGGGIVTVWHEPYLTYVGQEKEPEIEQDLRTQPYRISFKVSPIFKNWGLKPGHIENVKFSARELNPYPSDVTLNYCDRAAISLLSIFSGKTIICNFVATIDPKQTLRNPVTFQVSYYGPGGHEILTESYRAIPQLKTEK